MVKREEEGMASMLMSYASSGSDKITRWVVGESQWAQCGYSRKQEFELGYAEGRGVYI
jgi:hypothetical protein